MDCSTPGFPVHHQFLELAQTHVHQVISMPSSHLIFCHPLLLLPSIFPSIRVFSNESVLHIRWPKYWSFSFSISLSNEYLGLISFRIDWFDLFAVQGTLKCLLHPQFKSINSSAFSPLYGPAFTSVHDYWKNHTLTIMVYNIFQISLAYLFPFVLLHFSLNIIINYLLPHFYMLSYRLYLLFYIFCLVYFIFTY